MRKESDKKYVKRSLKIVIIEIESQKINICNLKMPCFNVIFFLICSNCGRRLKRIIEKY